MYVYLHLWSFKSRGVDSLPPSFYNNFYQSLSPYHYPLQLHPRPLGPSSRQIIILVQIYQVIFFFLDCENTPYFYGAISSIIFVYWVYVLGTCLNIDDHPGKFNFYLPHFENVLKRSHHGFLTQIFAFFPYIVSEIFCLIGCKLAKKKGILWTVKLLQARLALFA